MPKQPRQKGNKLDVRHVFNEGDLDVAQSHYDDMPKEAHDYLERVLIHNAGLGPKPAPYSGPAVSDPTSTEQDQ
ncbi:MAG: hypothetical protein WBW33_16745 [Bryobacteraceae bacterium]